ncbi:MAG: PQQ-binding-like beta-propeller repeat protein [Planctomycetaceae bacterium]
MSTRTMIRSLMMLTVAIVASQPAVGDWRQFRGDNVDGVSPTGNPPVNLSGDTIAWRSPLPGRGLSSPIIVGDGVYVTASSGAAQERLHVLCFDAATGQQRWERQFWATGRTVTHDKTNVAAPTPCSDGARIFAFYSSNDVICLGLDGEFQWARGLTWDFPNASNSLGMSSSPVVVGETLVAMVENDDDSFSIGLDTSSGTTRWKIDRPRKANWTSPTILRGEKDLVLLQSSAGIAAIDPSTGKEQWTYTDGASTIPSLVVAGDTAFVPSKGLTAVRAEGGQPNASDVLWQEGGLSPGTGSPIALGDKLYFVNNAGVLTCAEQATGKRLWQKRLAGSFSGSPVIASNRLYAVNEAGTIFCVDLSSAEGEILSSFDLEQTILCTPAIAGNAMYVRSDKELVKLAAPVETP